MGLCGSVHASRKGSWSTDEQLGARLPGSSSYSDYICASVFHSVE